jgi:sugar phosphate isomerase/epimerase
MFKFSFNSTTLREMDLLDALKRISAAGYDAVELMLNPSHLNPVSTPHQRIAEVRDFCRSENISICAIAAGGDNVLSDRPYQPTFFDPDTKARARRIDFLRRSIELADYLGVPVLDFNSGPIHPEVSREQSWEYFTASVNSLLGLGGNVILSLEPEPDFLVGTTVDGIQLLTEINHPRLALTTDIGHVNVSEDDCYGAIKHAMPYTRNIHIEDIKGRIHRHEIPGDGDIDFDRVFEILNKANYSHFITVELHHHNDRWLRALDESLAYLNRYRAVAA